MKVGDLVKVPADGQYWWGDRVGIVTGFSDDGKLVRVAIGNDWAEFSAWFLELISETKGLHSETSGVTKEMASENR